MSNRTVTMDVTRYSQGTPSPMKETVPIEAPVQLILNERVLASFSCTPRELEYLGVGHLVSRGLLTEPEQLISVETSRGPDLTEIRIRTRDDRDPIDTRSGSSIREKQRPVTVANLLASVAFLRQGSPFFHETGSAHRTIVFQGDHPVADHEDIARHNTLDKVLGRFFCDQIPTDGTILCTTGRLFYQIVSKGAAGRFPVIVSKGAATDRAIELASGEGITLVGFARGDRFNIYCHAQRIRA